MIDFKGKPFYLDDEKIKLVEETFDKMTLDEKIGQLFVLLNAAPGFNENVLKAYSEKYKIGGFRWQNQDMLGAYKQNTTLQKLSKIPVLIAANCDDGGNGAVPNGTFVATAVECGAGKGTENAYNLGLVSGREASAIGANWMFNPVSDIYMNWRNTIVNTRAFGDNAETVIENAKAYIKGVKAANPNMACTAKHFPGDGVEELDQHLVLGVNDLSVKEWENSFGKVYRTLIGDGLEAIMVGHIALPEMSRKLRLGIADKEIKPATLAPELLQDLLRKDMGFNGVIITDASHMMGMAAVEKRSEYVPNAIIAGCDMFLFANDVEEDMGYVKAAYERGELTDERLSEAVLRILALKAHLNLFDKSVAIPSEKLMEKIGCEEHKKYAVKAAEECITLVKDTRNYLPLNPEKQKRCFLVYVGSTPTSRAFSGDPTKKVVIEELERAGFIVDACPSFYELEAENGVNFKNMLTMMSMDSRKKFVEEHDFALVVVNVKGYAQENCVRIRWSCGHSKELPWYNEEIPTIGMSLNYTNHLIDLPQLHTFINAYAPTRDNIKIAIEKMLGKSEFSGKAQENVFCGRFETRL